MSKVYLNDKIVDSDQAMISAMDAGFLYGAGLFETMRCHNGVVFSLQDHLDRLFFSSAKLGINISHDKQGLSHAIDEVLTANGLNEARIRLTVSTGVVAGDSQEVQSTVLIAATELQDYPDVYYQKGIQVILCPHRQNPSDPLTGHKTTSCFSRMTAIKQAHQKKAAEALWFTTDGRLAEGCISNCFLVKNEKILTPPIETRILPGVARENVCKIAIRDKIELIERPLIIDDLLASDEVFLTNVIMKVIPVIGIEKHTVGTGSPGPMTQRLITRFNEEIENQCRPHV